MLDSVQRLQLVHSATSMIMFHFFIALLSLAFARISVSSSAKADDPVITAGPGVLDARFRGHDVQACCVRHLYFAGTRCAAFRLSRTSLSFSISAYVPDMCSVRRSHSSTCTSELAPASEWVDFVCVRSGVSRLRQPPRSTDLPGSPIGS